MNRGFYTVASGMMTQQRTLNTISNNMANGKTPGFRSERVVTTTFEQEFMVRQEGNRKVPIGKGAPVIMVEDVVSDFNATSLMESERPYDIAIQGEGYFTVADAEGRQFLTRNGNFDIDEEGFLILPALGRVQGAKGDIQIGGSEFTVFPDGTVYDNTGKVADTMLIQAPPEDVKLSKYANGMFRPEADAELTVVEDPKLAQFVLEGSNVDYNNEVALMIQTQRSFQSCAKALTIIDELNQRTARLAENG